MIWKRRITSWIKLHPWSVLTVLLTSMMYITILVIRPLGKIESVSVHKSTGYFPIGALMRKLGTRPLSLTAFQKAKQNRGGLNEKVVDEAKLRLLVEKKSGLHDANSNQQQTRHGKAAEDNSSHAMNDKTNFTKIWSASEEPKLHNNITVRPDTCKGCFQHNYGLIINNDICGEGDDKSKVTFIILIFSELNSIKRRTAIRKTWASYSQNNTRNIRYAFLFGDQGSAISNRKLLEESHVFHDILQEDFVDSYKNLTLKSIMALKWASEHCSNAKYYMKTDDDTWINMPPVMSLLPRANLSTTMIGMCAYYNTGPIRDKKYTKWYIPVEKYPHKLYPQYCAGSGYITSVDVATKVYSASKDIPFFEMEDVYVGLCLQTMGIPRRHVKGFESYHIKYKNCLYKSDKMYTNHYVTPELMYRAWNESCPLY